MNNIEKLRSYFIREQNGWTGGQYAIFRAILGIYLVVHFAVLIPWGKEMFSNQGCLSNSSDSPLSHLFPNMLAVFDSPAAVVGLLSVAALVSGLFAVGIYDRVAALCLWYVWACLYGRNPFIFNPALAYVGVLLLAHTTLPSAASGSVRRGGDLDSGKNWRFPQSVFIAVWILMALGYTYSGYTKLVSPSWLDGTAVEKVLNCPLVWPGALRNLVLSAPQTVLHLLTYGALCAELSFAPLALFSITRPWAWTLMLVMHVWLILLINFADLSIAMILLHLFTADPAWIKAVEATGEDTVFYDGHCSLCHSAVRFLLAEDRAGNTFRFAPLESDAFTAAVSEMEYARLPDSLVLITAEGHLLVQSLAWLRILERLGGFWRLIAVVGKCIPPIVRDRAYDWVVKIRHRMFARRTMVCPIVMKELRTGFDFDVEPTH